MRLYWFLSALILDVIHTVLKSVAVSKLTRPVSDLWDQYTAKSRQKPNRTLYGRQQHPRRDFDLSKSSGRSQANRPSGVSEKLVQQAVTQLNAGVDQYKIQMNLISEGVEPDIAHDIVTAALKKRR